MRFTAASIALVLSLTSATNAKLDSSAAASRPRHLRAAVARKMGAPPTDYPGAVEPVPPAVTIPTSTMHAYQKDIPTLNAEIEGIAGDIMTAEYMKKAAKEADNDDAYKQYKEELKDLQKKQKELQELVDAKEALLPIEEMERINLTVAQNKDTIAAIKLQLIPLLARINELKAKRAPLEIAYNDLMVMVAGLDESAASLIQASADSIKVIIDTANGEVADIEEKIAPLQADETRLVSEIYLLTEQYNASMEAMEILDEAATKAAISDLKLMIADYEEKIDAVNLQIDALMTTKLALAEEKAQLHASTARMMIIIESLGDSAGDSVASLQEAVNSVQGQIATIDEKIADVERDITPLQIEKMTMESEKTLLEEKVDGLED